MTCNEFTFLSADGETRLHAVEWVPEGEIRGILQISHGVSEYILRYEPFAAWLTERGFAVAGHDHLGHGQSVRPEGKRLYFGPKGSWEWVVQDIHTRRELVGKRFPDVPCFLLGHSMGSFLARTYLIRYPGTVDGAVIMGTGQMTPGLLAGARVLAAEEGLRVGRENTSALVNMLSFGAYNKIFAPNRTPCDWLSLDEANVDAYLKNPLCRGTATVGLFQEMLRGIRFIGQRKNVERMDRSTPVLFVSGEMDPVGECGKGVRRAAELLRAAGVRDLTVKLYPQLRHEILNEACKEEIYSDIYEWLSAHMPEK